MTKSNKTKTENEGIVIELSTEEKIIKYIENSNSDKVDLVPFLKSLFPLPLFSEPAVYLQQGESKRLRVLLSKMQSEGKISFIDNQYLKLGTHYYADGDTKTRYYTIDNIKIFANK